MPLVYPFPQHTASQSWRNGQKFHRINYLWSFLGINNSRSLAVPSKQASCWWKANKIHQFMIFGVASLLRLQQARDGGIEVLRWGIERRYSRGGCGQRAPAAPHTRVRSAAVAPLRHKHTDVSAVCSRWRQQPLVHPSNSKTPDSGKRIPAQGTLPCSADWKGKR